MRVYDKNLKKAYLLIANHVATLDEVDAHPTLVKNNEWYVSPTCSVTELMYVVDGDVFIAPKQRFRIVYDHEFWKNRITFVE